MPETLDIEGIRSAVASIQQRLQKIESFAQQLQKISNGIPAGWNSQNSMEFKAGVDGVVGCVHTLQANIGSIASAVSSYGEGMSSADASGKAQV